MVLKDLFCSFIFFTRPPTVHPYFCPSTMVFTRSNDRWTGLCVKICLSPYVAARISSNWTKFAVVINYLTMAIILIASPPALISQATARSVIDPQVVLCGIVGEALQTQHGSLLGLMATAGLWSSTPRCNIYYYQLCEHFFTQIAQPQHKLLPKARTTTRTRGQYTMPCSIFFTQSKNKQDQELFH